MLHFAGVLTFRSPAAACSLVATTQGLMHLLLSLLQAPTALDIYC